MEPDRFKQNQKSYIIGIVCLVISVCLFAFSLYLIPFLAFGWYHGIPDAIVWVHLDLQDTYQLSRAAASWILFIVIFLSAAVFAVIADILSNRIDSEIHHMPHNEPDKKKERIKIVNPESRGLVFKILLIMIVVFVAARFFQWIIST